MENKKAFFSIVIIGSVLFAFSRSGLSFQREGGYGGGGRSSGASSYSKKPAASRAVPRFPKYPKPAARSNGGNQQRPVVNHVPAHADSLGNRVTADHLSRVDFAHNRSESVMRNDPRVTDVVRVNRARFTNFYRPEFEHRIGIFNGFVSHYNGIIIAHPPFLDIWHHHYFFGGFYWGFHPIVDIDAYFYNPMVYWFYVGTFDDYYYRNWYRTEYDTYPELHKPFEYHGLYYPTENLKQLLFGVSAMTGEKQASFRTAISTFTRKLAQNMANGLGTRVRLSNGDIAVTHYEVINYDNAVDLEGIVNYKGQSYNFKGLIDLENPSESDVFVPATWDKNPTPEQLAKLDSLNAHISSLKGIPEPEVSTEPEPVMSAPPSGEVSADPAPNP